MSDYIPHPDTEMHINQMPEECLRSLFSQLPVETQFEAGNVCQLWRTVRDALFHTKKSLVVVVDHSYTDTSNGLIIAGLKTERTAFLVAMFPSLSKLAIFIPNRILFEESSRVAHLLDQYHDQLVTLKINSEGDWIFLSSFKRTVTCAVLFGVISSMFKLKQLSLDIVESSGALLLEPFDLPILRQLDKFDLNCSITSGSTALKLWAPHLEARSTPMEISFTGSLGDASFDSITPKVGSMFIKFPKLQVNLEQFRHLSTCFTNLTQLSLSDYATTNLHYTSDVPALMRALVNLKQLTTLTIEALYVDPLNGQSGDDDRLPQLPTIKKWHLELRPPRTHYSHAHLSPWTANLSRFFPALEDLSITIDSVPTCDDCGLIHPIVIQYLKDPVVVIDNPSWPQLRDVDVPAKACLRRQLGLIKQQQCPKLSQACIRYSGRADRFTSNPVSCTLDYLAD